MFKEHKTVEKLLEELKRVDGIHIERGVANLETAFIASLGGPKEQSTIAMLAEYDALPETGHGCGHNLICTSTVGAMLGLAPVIGKLPGRVELIGTPAEEGGGGKIIMQEHGVFDHVDAMYSIHPQRFNAVGLKMLGAKQVRFKFKGKSAHAGATPHLGRSAVEAVIQTFVNVNGIRQYTTEDTRIHGIIEDGGTKANEVPASGSCLVWVRALDEDYLEELMDRVILCAKAAAMSTETELEIAPGDGPYYRPLMCNQMLTRVMREILEDFGVTEFKDIKYTTGSNDMGPVSHEVPASRAWLKICEEEIPIHSPQFAQAAISEKGREVMILAAKLQALTAIELLGNPRLLEEIKEEFHKSK